MQQPEFILHLEGQDIVAMAIIQEEKVALDKTVVHCRFASFRDVMSPRIKTVEPVSPTNGK